MDQQKREGRAKHSGVTRAISQYLNVPEEYIRGRLTKEKRKWIFSRLKQMITQKKEKDKQAE